eukprot:gnl/TRDRNA2_/TRDRNA2_161774_c0_seq2.p1 gnl/TRDRNA2_/TRDRNA2_161774_c0~~gnl/TRDRNA2_/TRDRNA2_161774_c0_seq2.p1  ORF type:complete len:523 (+),score=98.16 gnl/TRDRNA2_/TRDRNA2_161774_c0_seq2:106-1674(+)
MCSAITNALFASVALAHANGRLANLIDDGWGYTHEPVERLADRAHELPDRFGDIVDNMIDTLLARMLKASSSRYTNLEGTTLEKAAHHRLGDCCPEASLSSPAPFRKLSAGWVRPPVPNLKWFLALSAKPIGPMDEAGVAGLVRAGTASSTTLVWCEGQAGWQAMGQVPELAAVLRNPAGSIPAANAAAHKIPLPPGPPPVQGTGGSASAEPNKAALAGKKAPRQTNSVYVTGLPVDATPPEIHDCFLRCGILAKAADGTPKVRLYTDKITGLPQGDALITYLKRPSVELALMMLNKTSFRPGGKEMIVSEAIFDKSKDEQSQAKRDRPTDPKAKGGQGGQGGKGGKAKRKAGTDEVDPELSWQGSDDELPARLVTVILKGMFDLAEVAEEAPTSWRAKAWWKELEEEIKEECEKYGQVLSLKCFKYNPEGVISVRFFQPEDASRCAAGLNGRAFANRRVVAQMWDGFTSYVVEAPKKHERTVDGKNILEEVSDISAKVEQEKVESGNTDGDKWGSSPVRTL